MSGVARERERLAAVYAEQSDEELLDLCDRRDDLTEVAQEALAETMRERKLEPRAAVVAASTDPAGESTEAGEDEVFVYRFRDSLGAVTAANLLTYAEIPHRMAVHPYPGGGQAGASVTLFVENADEMRARDVLQRKMHLFPDEQADGPVEMDGPMVLGEFTREQAALVTKALEEKGIAHETDEGDRDGAPVLVTVPGERLEEAFAVVEEIADTLPPDPDEASEG